MSKVIADTSRLTRDEWLEYRRLGIGGSDVAPICGLSPWVSPKEIYHSKKGTIPPTESNDAMYWGSALEPLILDEFIKRHPEVTCSKPTFIYQSETKPFMLANIDGWIIDPELGGGIFEAKTASSEDGWSEGVPDYYMLQIQHYMYVMEARFAWVAVLFSGRKYLDFFVERDEDIIKYIITIEEKFWSDLQKNIEPDVTVQDKFILELIHGKEVKGKEVELPDLQLNVDIITATKTEIKTLQDVVIYNENIIKDRMKDAEVGIINTTKVTWKTINRDGYSVEPGSYRKFNLRLPRKKKEDI